MMFAKLFGFLFDVYMSLHEINPSP